MIVRMSKCACRCSTWLLYQALEGSVVEQGGELQILGCALLERAVLGKGVLQVAQHAAILSAACCHNGFEVACGGIGTCHLAKCFAGFGIILVEQLSQSGRV